MAETAHIVNIPPHLWKGALHVIREFCGPDVQTGEYVEGDLSHPCFKLGDDVVGHTSGQGPLGIRFWTHIKDLALRLEGYVEAQEDVVG